MLFIGPTPLSGIGQHCKKYMDIFPRSKYLEIHEEIPECERAFIFALPVPNWLDKIPEIKRKIKHVTCMTVCETETVHEDYGKLFDLFDRIAVPSEFCRKVFKKQFPDKDFFIIHAHIPDKRPYTFYHIGNVHDPRKNFNKIIETFVRMNKPDSRLLVKATCKQPVEARIPNVTFINGLVSDEDMEKIHEMGDCYVSFSSSEGVGMGAVEAALRNKPVIITNYGGAPEYIKTPYLIECGLQYLVKDDFLFKAGMEWGKPNENQLREFMEDAYTKKIRYMEHPRTHMLTCKENVLQEFITNVIGKESDNTGQDGTGHE
jgi:glycosyltransferase involved in cell wall biosynthesis